MLLFLLLSLVLTYPLPLHLADAVEDRQDALLNVWITTWDGHQLLGNPLHLFDANIFHPYPRTLAYSELLLGNALLSLPITATTGNPVLGYNLALLLSFILSGFGTYLLVLRLTDSTAAGMVAGVIFAFSSYRMTNLAQAQLLTTQWLPFALLALYELLRPNPVGRHIAMFALFFCLQTLSSFYYGILLALAVLGFVIFDFGVAIAQFSQSSRATHDVSRTTASRNLSPRVCRPPAEALSYLLLAACCCVLVVLPFALPYFQVQRELGFERSLADNEPFSASLSQYLMVPPRSIVHGLWLPSDDAPGAGGYPVDALFPGFVALALALWGLARGQGRTRWFFLILLLAAFVLSLGPRLFVAPGQPSGWELSLPYAWLYAFVPGFQALRAPVRFDALVQLSLAVLAGYGTAALRGIRILRCGPRQPVARGKRMYWVVGAILLLLISLESLVWPGARAESVPVGDGVPQVYRWLARQAPAPVLELPMAFTPGGPQLDYQYLSTYHWQTTPDGYSGFIPPKHGQIVYEMERFPSERSVSLLQALGVEQVILHTDRYSASRWAEMRKASADFEDLVPGESFGPTRVYGVQPRTFDADDLVVQGHLPFRAAAGEPYTAYVIALNGGPRSYAVQPTELIRPDVLWETTGGTPPIEGKAEVEADVPLVTSPEGGAAVIPLRLRAPSTPGSYRLTLGEQHGPLGAWNLDGMVEVGEHALHEGDAGAFPIPAQLSEWRVPDRVRPGDPLPVDLTWRALGKIDAYYSLYVKLLDAAGHQVTGWDGQPREGQAPTLLWEPGEKVEDRIVLVVPRDTPPGDYTVKVGMYRAADLAQALTLNLDRQLTEEIALGTVHVEP
jgi:hypothetical protein